MREITQAEAVEMRRVLREIAGSHNPAQVRDGGQAAAERARNSLISLNLFYEADVNPPPSGGSAAKPPRS